MCGKSYKSSGSQVSQFLVIGNVWKPDRTDFQIFNTSNLPPILLFVAPRDVRRNMFKMAMCHGHWPLAMAIASIPTPPTPLLASPLPLSSMVLRPSIFFYFRCPSLENNIFPGCSQNFIVLFEAFGNPPTSQERRACETSLEVGSPPLSSSFQPAASSKQPVSKPASQPASKPASPAARIWRPDPINR